MDGEVSVFVVLVRPEDLPESLKPHVIATRVSPLQVGGKSVEGFPEKYLKGWPSCLDDSEAEGLGVTKRKGPFVPFMGGVEPTNLVTTDTPPSAGNTAPDGKPAKPDPE
jgi:hypothetical protein